MNTLRNLLIAFLNRRFAFAAVLLSLYCLNGHFATALGQQRAAWRFREVLVSNYIDGKFGSVIKQRYDKNGGEIVINLKGEAHNLCNGGSESVRLTWKFAGDISQFINNGNGVGISIEAVQLMSNRPCTIHLANRVNYSVRDSEGFDWRALPKNQHQYWDSGRFALTTDPQIIVAAADDNKRAARTGVKIKPLDPNPSSPITGFSFLIGTPAGEIYYNYVFELVSNNTGGRVNNGEYVYTERQGNRQTVNNAEIDRLRQWVAYYENLINQWIQYRDQKVAPYYNDPTYYKWARAEYQKANQAIGSSQQYKTYYQNLLRQAGGQ